jgi:hypothetical protein
MKMSETYSARSLSALFDTREDADEAVSRLAEIGITGASVRVTGGEEYARRSTGQEDDKGFWESIADFFFPEDDREAYAEGLRRGGYLVSVTGISADQFDAAVDILDDEGSVNLDERAQAWRSEGWTGARSISSGDAASDEFTAGAQRRGGWKSHRGRASHCRK